ncbi:DUF86 domain-containing protein [bacterium]|nr:DUF86 domain-containing protein [bacterium]
MSRGYRLYLSDIIDSTSWLIEQTSALSFDQFMSDRALRQAAERNCEIIGEAAKRIPDEIKAKMCDVDWRGLANLRDVVIHRYHRLDHAIIWDAINNEFTVALEGIRDYLESLKD